MRSTRKEVTSKVHEHILECVNDYDGDELRTPKEAATLLYNDFLDAYGDIIEAGRPPNEASYFRRYINDGNFNFLFWTVDKRDWIISLGIAQKRKYSDKDVEKYYAWLIYRETIKLIKK